MSNRPLRDGEIFEIVIERTVDRWSGAIEAGVTLIRPEDLEFPNTVITFFCVILYIHCEVVLKGQGRCYTLAYKA